MKPMDSTRVAAPSNKESGFAEVNGTRLHYQLSGSGPVLILMHGFGGDLRVFNDMLEFLEPKFRVVLYDMRGFGKSALPMDAENHYVEDLKSLMAYLGIEKAYIGGQSLGDSRPASGRVSDAVLGNAARLPALAVPRGFGPSTARQRVGAARAATRRAAP